MVESPEEARHRARPDHCTLSLGCVPVHSVDLITEAPHTTTRPGDARASAEEDFTGEGVATSSHPRQL